jgi:hypothetical protein
MPRQMPDPRIGRRVIDRVTGDIGTVVEIDRSRCRISWEQPTPHQDKAWVRVPSEFIDWYSEEVSDA